jgi:hypothetical protein
MCFLRLVKLIQPLIELVNQLVRLVELMRIIKKSVSQRIVQDGGIELHTALPLVIDELVHDFAV